MIANAVVGAVAVVPIVIAVIANAVVVPTVKVGVVFVLLVVAVAVDVVAILLTHTSHSLSSSSWFLPFIHYFTFISILTISSFAFFPNYVIFRRRYFTSPGSSIKFRHPSPLCPISSLYSSERKGL